jgi:hypothetical protein
MSRVGGGPVQVLVVGFDHPSFSGGVLEELTRLREAGVVRLVDVLLVRREDDGSFDTLEPPPGFDPDLGRLVAAVLGGGEDQRTPDGAADRHADEPADGHVVWSLADVVEPGSVAAVALLEHLWAGPLVTAIAEAGGRPLGDLWLSPEDRARLA